MKTGPFAAPLALASRPLMALFWAVFAPTLATFLLVAALNLVTGNWASAQFEPGGDISARFMLVSLAYFAVFIAMTFWSERIGAGAFGGPIRASGDWIAIGVVTGPVILMVSSALVASLQAPQNPDWMYREGYDPMLFTAEALSPLMLMFVVVLAPLVEEVGFRGFGLGCLVARGWNPVAANLVTALAFTSLHVQYTLPALIPILIMGLYLGALRLVSQSMAAPIAAHVSANAVSMLVFAISLA